MAGGRKELDANRAAEGDASVPVPQAHTWIHQTDSPQLTRISHHSLGDVKFEILDWLIAQVGFGRSALRVVAALMRAASGDAFRSTGRIFCEMTVPEMEDAACLSRSSVYAVVKKLVAAGVVWKEPGTGHRVTLWEVLIPQSGGETVQKTGPPARAAHKPSGARH